MAQVTVSLNTDNPFEASLLLQLSMNCASVHRDAVRTASTIAQPEVAPPSTPGTVTPATPAVEPSGANPGGDGVVSGAGAAPEALAPATAADVKPAKRTRKAVQVEEVPASTDGDPDKKADAATETKHTIDDIRNALSDYTQRHDLNAGIELLKQFDATRVSAVKEADYVRFIEACGK